MATKVEFARESLTPELWAEAMPLLFAHKGEIAHFADIPLEPDVAMYSAVDAAGALRCFTARRDGALIGYCLFFVRPNPHYASSVQAVQDVLYLDPERRGITGYRFVRWCDEQLAAEGVEVVYHHLKAKHDHPALMRALGYEVVDYIYARRLGGFG